MGNARKVISLRIDTELLDQVDGQARHGGYSRTAFIEAAIRAKLDHQDQVLSTSAPGAARAKRRGQTPAGERPRPPQATTTPKPPPPAGRREVVTNFKK